MLTLAIVLGAVVVIVLFAIAELLFSPGGAVLLTGGVGFCFAGPVGAGVGLVLGLGLALVTAVLGVLAAPSPSAASEPAMPRARVRRES